MIATFTPEVIQSFWKMGMLPKKSSIRFGEHLGNDRYQVYAFGMEIPEELMPDETPESLQAMVDAMWDRESSSVMVFKDFK